jgi:Fe-S cluster assembly protein SufD
MLHTALLLGVALHVRPPTPGCARPAPRCRASRLFLATEQQIGDDFFAAVLSTRAAESRAAESADLAQLREEATEALSGTERPGRKDEAWRRTDLSLLFASSFAPPPGAAAHHVRALIAGDDDGDDGARVVFVDGVFDGSLSDVSTLPDGVLAGRLADVRAVVAADASSALLSCMRSLPESGADPRTELGCYALAALNQAGLADIGCIYVPRGVAVTKPLRAVFVSTAPTVEAEALEPGAERTFAVSHPNLLVWLEEGSELELYQRYVGTGCSFTNALTRLELGARSTLRHAYVQEQDMSAVHLEQLVATVGAGSLYASQAVQLGSRISRLNLGVQLAGSGAATELEGLTLGAERQLLDVHSKVSHLAPDCVSSQEQRNALAGRARVVFKGAVFVPIGSDNTTANQLCRSLLLSDTARVDVQPTLEILTDEVGRPKKMKTRKRWLSHLNPTLPIVPPPLEISHK